MRIGTPLDVVRTAEEPAARTAAAVDNARRCTREHTVAVTLPSHARPERSALEVAYRHPPAQAGAGGDLSDVASLPGARIDEPEATEAGLEAMVDLLPEQWGEPAA
ncbi:hypothetical protein SUDANB6_05776 [Streptomyces sp. enrichment culture]|uniref:hypothetical protein n=1 Tax=Streptomyces sp. enrichment culture TaxID=1795815 RepID=UPI003F547F77